jgi:CRISPR-associated protein Cas2
MSARRHYLISYDIADDKRRTEVFKTLHGFGDHAQYSVFFCELNGRELALLRTRLRGAVHHREDQVLIVDLGHAQRPLAEGMEGIGKGYEPPTRTMVI